MEITLNSRKNGKILSSYAETLYCLGPSCSKADLVLTRVSFFGVQKHFLG